MNKRDKQPILIDCGSCFINANHIVHADFDGKGNLTFVLDIGEPIHISLSPDMETIIDELMNLTQYKK